MVFICKDGGIDYKDDGINYKDDGIDYNDGINYTAASLSCLFYLKSLKSV